MVQYPLVLTITGMLLDIMPTIPVVLYTMELPLPSAIFMTLMPQVIHMPMVSTIAELLLEIMPPPITMDSYTMALPSAI